MIPTSYKYKYYVIPTSYVPKTVDTRRHCEEEFFYPGLALTVARRDDIRKYVHVIRACVLCARIKTEVVTFTCNQDKMAAV